MASSSSSSAHAPASAFPKPSLRKVPATVLSAVLLAGSISGCGAGEAAGATATASAAGGDTGAGGGGAGAKLSGLFGKMGVELPTFSGDSSTYWKWLHEDVFAALDANGDGHFDADELGDHGMKHLDADGDGLVSMGEMTLSKALLLFATMDLDGDGELTGEEVPQELIDSIENHDGFEQNNDGKVDSVEFANFHEAMRKAYGMKTNAKPMTWMEYVVLATASVVLAVAGSLTFQTWRKNTSAGAEAGPNLGGNLASGIETYDLEFPPECFEYEDLKEAVEKGEKKVTEDELRQALFKRAVATVPMRVFVHQEERSLQRMYHNSMVAPETWNNFQRCADFVKEENETILAEANGIEEGWGERILSEAHWLDQYINSESKQASSIKAQEAALKKKKEQDAQRKREEIKAKVEAEKAKALAHEKAVAELEKEAKEEEAKKGAKQRKNKSKK